MRTIVDVLAGHPQASLVTRAVIYPRVSSVGQVDGCSLADQERNCRDYCAKQGYQVIGVVADTYSGYNSLDMRPGLQQIRDMLRREQAEVIVIWRLDRLAREQTDMLLLHREVSENGARLESATEGVVGVEATDKLLLSVRAYAAEAERMAIMQRTRGALRTRAEMGRLLVSQHAKIGYRFVGDRKASYEVDETSAPIVRRLFDMAYNGASLHEIARTFNAERVPTPTQIAAQNGAKVRRVATAWTRQSIWQLLTDSSFKGEHVVYRRRTTKQRVTTEDGLQVMRAIERMRTADDPQRIVQTIPAIVSEQIWERVQQNLQARSLTGAGVNTEPDATLLNRGIAHCGHCGSTAVSARHHATKTRMYQCSRRKEMSDDPDKTCPAKNWACFAKQVDDDVWAKVKEIASDLPHVRRMIDARLDGDLAYIEQVDREGKTIAAEMKDAMRQRDNLVERVANEDDDAVAALYRARIQKLNAHLKELADRGQANLIKQDVLLRQYVALEEANNLFKKNAGLDTLTRQEKRQILQALGVKVFIYSARSDYAKEHGQRWRIEFQPLSSTSDMLQSGGMPSE